MINIRIIYIIILLSSILFADKTTFITSFESFNFTNSKKKDNGNRFNIAINYQKDSFLWQIYYSKTLSNTFQPPLLDDLKVDKLYLKGCYSYDKFNSIYFGYATLNDNLMKDVDSGDIYNIGYRYENIKIMQYFSNYSQFNVYQSDIDYTLNYKLDDIKISINMAMKYIHLSDKNSNGFSKNAQEDYLTTGIDIHLLYPNFFIGSGVMFGKRAFAIMKNGFAIQHHAMEFDKTYQIGIGKKWNDIDVKLIYVHQEATELPIMNENVKVDNIILMIKYRF